MDTKVVPRKDRRPTTYDLDQKQHQLLAPFTGVRGCDHASYFLQTLKSLYTDFSLNFRARRSCQLFISKAHRIYLFYPPRKAKYSLRSCI